MKQEKSLILKRTLFGGGEKAVALDAAFSVIMSLITVFNKNAVDDHLFLDRFIVRRYIVLFFVYTAMFYAAVRIIEFLVSNEKSKATASSSVEISRLKQAVMMFLAWVPYLIIFLPGVANYDTVNQVNDFFDGVAPVPFGFIEGQETVNVFLNAHHPIVPTFIFSFFIGIGRFFGSATAGFLLYILCQMALGAILISGILDDLYNNAETNNGRYLIKAVRVFFMFMPFIPMYMICMLKNTMHSLLFILFIYSLYRYFAGMDSKPAKSWILFLLILLMLCVTLNTGVYVVLFTGIATLFIKDRNRYKIILVSMISMVVWFVIFPKVVYPALNVYPGGKQELYGTIFHQTARLVRDNEEEFTEEDKKIIDAVLDYEKIKENFSFEATDPVKDTFKLSASDRDISEYLKLWFRMGLRHPIVYLRATFSICGNFFSPGAGIQVFGDIPMAAGVFGEIHHILPRVLGDRLISLYYKISLLPVIRLLFSQVLYSFWIPVYLFYYMVIREKVLNKNGRKRPELIILVPLFVSVLFLVVSPMNYSRYALCLIFASPIILAMAGVKNKRS
ncbi:DUF6020 family protein [Butyrivibrio sp. LC3010]|uniref:DUF6020 family protein n=1 Tax=Butyrivibrio sp. LC3010 TaxID=1280680 RepID=UPI0003F7BDBB|nr:DUF6020 family protein [Butyrivibrio sp. LC3010]